MALNEDLVIQQGKTFSQVVRWESEPFVYKPITGQVLPAAPVSIPCTGHSVPNGWRVAIVSAKGMTQLNAASKPPKKTDYHVATVAGPNALELNDVNASDYKTHTSGTGYVQYYTPVDLAGYTARMKIKTKVGGTVLASTEAADSPLNVITITLDNTAKTITIAIAASATEDFTWTKGVYDLEMVSVGGVVTALLYGAVTVTKEITT